MDATGENNRIKEDTVNDAPVSSAEENTDAKGSDGEHHHHHHHHSDGEHHHHHHHHHHHSGSNSSRHHKSKKLRKIKKFFRNLFASPKSSNSDKYEPEKQKIFKKAMILFLIAFLFFASFYLLVIDNLDNEAVTDTMEELSETEILKDKLTKAEDEIDALKEELDAYKKAYGELDSKTSK